MIIDSPGLSSLALGAGRVIPTEGDAQVFFPPTLQAIVPIMQPTGIYSSSNGNSGYSNFTSLNLARNNQGGLTSQMQLLTKGLYDVEVMMAYISNFAAVFPAIKGAELFCTIGSNTNRAVLLCFFQALGVQSLVARYRILADSDITFSITLPVTGVAENLSIQASVNAVRIL